MERHTAECATCATERRSVEAVFASARALPSIETPAAFLNERVWNALPPQPMPTPSRRSLLLRCAMGGAAMAITAGSIAMLSFLPGTPVQPTPAFARVEEAMQGVRAVSWTETHSRHYQATKEGQLRNGKKTATINRRFSYWVTPAPPRYAMRETTESTPTQTADFSRVARVWDGETTVSYTQDRSTYSRNKVRATQGERTGPTPREWVRDLFLVRPPSETGESGTSMMLPGGVMFTPRPSERLSAWQSVKDTLNGRQALRFERWLTPDGKPLSHLGMAWKIWVDPKTYRVIRREFRTRAPLSNGVVTETVDISENFRYNETLPLDVFTLPVPPVGKPYQFTNEDIRSEVMRGRRDLASPEDAERIKAVLRKAAEAWNRRDRDSFAAQWDFTFNEKKITPLQRRPFNRKLSGNGRRWLAMLETPEITWYWPTESMEDAYTWDVLYERSTERDPFPPSPNTRPVVYEVTLRFSRQRPIPGTINGFFTRFILRRIGDDFRLVYMDTQLPLNFQPRHQRLSPPTDTTKLHSSAGNERR
jgi:hypothetical protein